TGPALEGGCAELRPQYALEWGAAWVGIPVGCKKTPRAELRPYRQLGEEQQWRNPPPCGAAARIRSCAASYAPKSLRLRSGGRNSPEQGLFFYEKVLL